VIAIRPDARTVVVGAREELLGRGVVARQINWLSDAPPRVGQRLSAQVRHRGASVAAELVRVETDKTDTGRDIDEIELAFDEPLAAIAPGQSLVLYDGDRVLGGSLIERADAAAPHHSASTSTPRPANRRPLPLAVA
jgi:tRNA-specific 2-thiouridylase